MKFKMHSTTEALIISTCFFTLFIGWILNFQNLFQYFPNSGNLSDAPIQWTLSALGILIAPLGAITGLIW